MDAEECDRCIARLEPHLAKNGRAWSLLSPPTVQSCCLQTTGMMRIQCRKEGDTYLGSYTSGFLLSRYPGSLKRIGDIER